jgi:cytochrome P450
MSTFQTDGDVANYFTLDVISDLTFGESFDMLTDPKLRWLVEAIVNGNRHIYLRFAWPRLFNMKPDRWYSPARWLFPTMLEDKKHFAAVAEERSRARMQGGKSDRRDIMAALLEATDPRTGEKLSQDEVWGEAHLMIAAGGDTTSTALAAILFFLSRTPDVYAKLADEIRSKFTDVEQIRRGKTFASCEYLKACIEEALRLAPAAPGSLWREVCEGGISVDRDFIPAGRDVGVCTYAIHHNEDYFPDSFAFRPERFLGDGTTNTNAFAPFSMGPRSCLALPLAYLELQLAVARLIFMMDFEAVNNQGGGSLELGYGRQKPEEFQIWDMFSSNKTGPLLRFKAR